MIKNSQHIYKIDGKDEYDNDIEDSLPAARRAYVERDISWYDGPLNDDWESSDWEDYMGGPDY